jgi:hypothetical protein
VRSQKVPTLAPISASFVRYAARLVARHGGRVRATSGKGTDRGRIQSGEGLLINRRGTGRRTVGLKGGARSSAIDGSGLRLGASAKPSSGTAVRSDSSLGIVCGPSIPLLIRSNISRWSVVPVVDESTSLISLSLDSSGSWGTWRSTSTSGGLFPAVPQCLEGHWQCW